MQRWSQLFIPTLREAPAGATSASQIYLLRSGYARRIGGEYHYLPLGQRVLAKLASLLRRKFATFAQEVDLAVGETSLARRATQIAADLRSYKQLPQVWLQMGARDAQAFSFGLADANSAAEVLSSIEEILELCALNFTEATDGPGATDRALIALSEAGDEAVLTCADCAYGATASGAASRLDDVADHPAKGNGLPLEVHTPGARTIEDVSRFLDVAVVHTAKTLTYFSADDGTERPIVALLRGDHMLNESKLGRALGCGFRPMEPAEAQSLFRAPFGSLGPVGIPKDAKPLILVDTALRGRKNLVTGANREDYHFWNVTPERDFIVDKWVDLRVVEAGEPCPACGAPLQERKAIRLASAAVVDSTMTVLDKNGKDAPVLQASYSLDLESILVAAIEQHHDDQGFWLSPSIAPFDVIVTVMSVRDEALMRTAVQIGESLESAGYEVLLDDRDERPGVKFKDADLSGIPYRVTVGKKVPPLDTYYSRC